MNPISPSAFNLATDAAFQSEQSTSLNRDSRLETPEQLAAVAEQFEAISSRPFIFCAFGGIV